MTYNPQTQTSPVISSDTDRRSYLDWGAVIGGIVFASAISIVLLSFGSGLGLAFASFSSKTYAIGAGIGVALWFIWVEVSSFMAGGYLAGRLRKTLRGISAHETEVRDGSHGLLVWAGCILVGASLALSGVGSVLNSAGNVAKTAVEAGAPITQGAASGTMQYTADTLLRAAPQTSALTPGSDRTAVAAEINTILARSALTSPTDEDKAYLVQLVAKQTTLSNDEAKVRVDQAYSNIEKAKADVAKAAEAARRLGVIASFLLAASLLISAAAAYWAASAGGRHRDEAAVFEGFFRRV